MNHGTHHLHPPDTESRTTVRQAGLGRFLRTLGVLLIMLTCLRIWTGAEPLIGRAQAQIPDSGRQRKLILDEARKTNQLLTEIAQILRDRTLNVRLAPADTQAGAPVLRPVRP